MSILFVEQLTVIDCAYLDPRRGLVGESWIVDVELEGDLDAQSMVLDFGRVKRGLKRAIDAGLDHTLVIPGRSPQLSLARSRGVTELCFRTPAGAIEHRSPDVAVSVLPVERIDLPGVRAHLEKSLTEGLPSNVAALRIGLRIEPIDGPCYQYVHGLKKHEGQCQRIAHGHRSRLEIRVDGAREPALEQALARAWTDIYLATREDLVLHSPERLRFAYLAPEGRFEIELPASRVDLLETDTTVECIAEHLARLAGARHPGAHIEVRAYEGVMKGALARVPGRP